MIDTGHATLFPCRRSDDIQRIPATIARAPLF
jgi:hypothetical protein